MGKVAVLFPGQGSQYVGMGKEFVEASDEARDMLEAAEKACSLPLGRLCFEGPMEELTAAANLQPAMTLANLLCWRALCRAGVRPDFLAGHSLGEYSALHAAGVLGLEDTFRLVAARGRIMGGAGEKNPGGMAAILGLKIDEVRAIAEASAPPESLAIGNHNSETQVVLSGEDGALSRACEAAAERGGKAVRLNVSIANHSPLMAGAVPAFEEAMAQVEFSRPRIPVFFNVTAAAESDPAAIRGIMARQIVSMVRWHEIIAALVDEGVTVFIEAGPKKVLTGLLKRSLPKGSGFVCCQADTPAAVEKCVSAIA